MVSLCCVPCDGHKDDGGCFRGSLCAIPHHGIQLIEYFCDSTVVTERRAFGLVAPGIKADEPPNPRNWNQER